MEILVNTERDEIQLEIMKGISIPTHIHTCMHTYLTICTIRATSTTAMHARQWIVGHVCQFAHECSCAHSLCGEILDMPLCMYMYQ